MRKSRQPTCIGEVPLVLCFQLTHSAQPAEEGRKAIPLGDTPAWKVVRVQLASLVPNAPSSLLEAIGLSEMPLLDVIKKECACIMQLMPAQLRFISVGRKKACLSSSGGTGLCVALTSNYVAALGLGQPEGLMHPRIKGLVAPRVLHALYLARSMQQHCAEAPELPPGGWALIQLCWVCVPRCMKRAHWAAHLQSVG